MYQGKDRCSFDLGCREEQILLVEYNNYIVSHLLSSLSLSFFLSLSLSLSLPSQLMINPNIRTVYTYTGVEGFKLSAIILYMYPGNFIKLLKVIDVLIQYSKF